MLKSQFRQGLVDTVFFVLEKTGGHFLTRASHAGIGHILMFHRVCPGESGPRISANADLEITPQRLEEIIRYFRKRDFDIISMDEVHRRLVEGASGRKFVAFTFDDGYADNAVYALPVMRRYSVPFTIYVTTCFPDHTALMWWYLLEDLVLSHDHIAVKYRDRESVLACDTMKSKEAVFSEIRTLLLSRYEGDWEATLRATLDMSGTDLYARTGELALGWDDIARLGGEQLVTIGAHTTNHYALSTLPESRVRQEIMDCKSRLEAVLPYPVLHFAYPFGTRREAGSREFRIVRELGFKTATTTRLSNLMPGHRDYLECLPRNYISARREGSNIGYLDLWTDGTIPCLMNRFRRMVTV